MTMTATKPDGQAVAQAAAIRPRQDSGRAIARDTADAAYAATIDLLDQCPTRSVRKSTIDQLLVRLSRLRDDFSNQPTT